MILTADLIERSADPRSTDELLQGILHGREERVHPWWISQRYYQYYAGLAALARPASILEIGVRLGYSLIALYRGHPQVSLLAGLDDESYEAGLVRKAEENLRAAGYSGRLEFHRASSNGWSTSLRGRRFDLIHIDGDHSFMGCFRDIVEYWGFVAAGGILVVDDANVKEIRDAVAEAKRVLPSIAWDFYLNHDAGWHVVGKDAVPSNSGKE